MTAGIGQVWRREMKCLLVAAMLAALVWPAGAAQRYDRKLEEQVKRRREDRRYPRHAAL
jgi:hypothetical protein